MHFTPLQRRQIILGSLKNRRIIIDLLLCQNKKKLGDVHAPMHHILSHCFANRKLWRNSYLRLTIILRIQNMHATRKEYQQ